MPNDGVKVDQMTECYCASSHIMTQYNQLFIMIYKYNGICGNRFADTESNAHASGYAIRSHATKAAVYDAAEGSERDARHGG